jgi:hypothetical protein
MKFFTPKLYVMGNSADPKLVDRAEREWRQAIHRYQKHYQKIAALLPEHMRKFHDEQCLHDADVFGPAMLSSHSLRKPLQDVVIIARQVNTLIPEFKNTLAILQYTITEQPTIEMPVASDCFTDIQPIWLYDELDVGESEVFSHEILLSTGQVIKIVFKNFEYHIANLVDADGQARKQTRKSKLASG